MKPMFCADVTVDKNNEIQNGDELIAARVSEETAARRDGASDTASGLLKKSELPFPLLITKYLLFGFFLLVAGVTLTVSIEEGFATAWGNAPWLIVLAALSGVVALGILIYEKSKKNAVEESGEVERVAASLDDLEKLVNGELLVPEDAPKVDILVFNYKVKEDGSIKPVPMKLLPYLIFEGRLFRHGDSLAIADWDARYDIPLDGLGAIEKIEKPVTVPAMLWSKPVSWEDEPYKAFKIKNADGNLLMKHHYVLSFTAEGESWGIYFPPYELPAFEAVSGLKANE